MPVERTVICTRPDFDVATLYASYWVGITLRVLEEMGMRVTDLPGNLANKDELLIALERDDPIAYWGVGHGNETQFAGQDAVVMLEKGVDENLFVERIIHLTSCLTGAEGGLLGSIAEAGALATIGYSVELVVGIDTANFPVDDPSNKATQSLLEPDCLIEVSLAGGKTVADAFVESDAKSDEWIEYWRVSGHPDADILMWALINNRDNKVLDGLPQTSYKLQTEPLHPLTVLASTATILTLGLMVIKW